MKQKILYIIRRTVNLHPESQRLCFTAMVAQYFMDIYLCARYVFGVRSFISDTDTWLYFSLFPNPNEFHNGQ